MRPMPSPAPAAIPAHFDGLLRRLSFAFIVIAFTRGFTDAIATRASFTFARLRDLTFRGTAASLSFQVRSSEVVWISMISLRGLHLFVLPARCHVICSGLGTALADQSARNANVVPHTLTNAEYRSLATRYLAAIALTALATVLQLWLSPVLGGARYLILIGAI